MFANTKLDDAVRRAIDLLESLGGEFNSLAEVLNGEIEKLARGKLKEVCPTIIAVSDGSWDCQEFHYPGFIQNFELRAKNKKKATAYLSYQVNFCPPPRIPMLLMVGIDDDIGGFGDSDTPNVWDCNTFLHDDDDWKLKDGFLITYRDSLNSSNWFDRCWMFAVPLTLLTSVDDVKRLVIEPLVDLLSLKDIADLKAIKKRHSSLYQPIRSGGKRA